MWDVEEPARQEQNWRRLRSGVNFSHAERTFAKVRQSACTLRVAMVCPWSNAITSDQITRHISFVLVRYISLYALFGRMQKSKGWLLRWPASELQPSNYPHLYNANNELFQSDAVV